MKKISMIIILLLFNFSSLWAQSGSEQIPLMEQIRHGKLENGLTYYILHNEEPKDRVSFYIVHNVGAILEEDNQNGLAHFLEHMAFNGTEHFPGKGIINYLEKNGVKFGRNINAYTSYDETVYNISNVPASNTNLVDSCLLVLYDWSQNLLLTKEEIDAERGVITEEWRTRRDSRFRMSRKRSKLFYDSKYSQRDVIGDLDIIQNFKHKTIRKFYEKWYRPDLQAIVVVGDVDVERIEAEIETRFADLSSPKKIAERKYFEIPDNEEPRYVLATDKEATGKTVTLEFKFDRVKDADKDLSYLRDQYSKSIFHSMMESRIEEKLQEEDAAFVNARARISPFYRTKNKASIIVSYKNDDWNTALTQVCEIVENVRDYGFTETEIERAKENLLRSVENSYNKRNKINNDLYARRIQTNFLRNEPVPGIVFRYKYLKKTLPEISSQEISKWAQLFFAQRNMLIAVAGPDTDEEKYPGMEDVLRVVNAVKETKLSPYVDNYKEKALIPNEIQEGSIVEINQLNELGAKEYVLSNGIKVYGLQSDIEEQKIVFAANSFGGASKLPAEQLPSYMLFKGFFQVFGVGDFSSTELKKALSGKIVTVRPEMGKYLERLSGSASPKDLETMFKLVYLYYTSPRFDEDAFKAMKDRYRGFVKNISNDINRAFKDSVSRALNNYHPRVLKFNDAVIDALSFDAVKSIYLDRFQNPGDFTFMIAGNYNEDKLEVCLQKYIASLPATPENENYSDNGIRTPGSEFVNHYKVEMATPKASVYVNFHNQVPYTELNRINLYLMGQLLSKRYMEEIREKEGGTYGVSVSYKLRKTPVHEAQLFFTFDCDYEKVDKLKQIALREFEQLVEGNISEEDLEEAKKNLVKERIESAEKLSYWYDKLYDYAVYHELTMSKDEFVRYTNSITKENIAEKAKEILKDAKKIEVVMTPKN